MTDIGIAMIAIILAFTMSWLVPGYNILFAGLFVMLDVGFGTWLKKRKLTRR